MPTVMDRIYSGLLGPAPNYGGILNPQQQQDAQAQARTAMAAGLLQAGGYSDRPVGLGQALGAGMMAGQRTQQQALEQALQANLMRSQIARNQRGDDPASVREYEYAKANGYKGSFQDWTTVSGQTSRPSSVQEWEFFSKLDSNQQQRYLEMKRNPNFMVKDVNQAPTAIVGTPGGNFTATPLSTTGSEAAAAGAIAAGTAAGKTAGETTATAKFDLPRVEDNASQTLALLDRLEKHPGRKLATGASSMVPVDKLAGTDARDFVALLGQLRGKQFLEAFNMLKGGGQITEVEGQKAESAIATIQDRGQSEEAYLQAIEDLRGVINAGVKRAREKAGSGSTPAPRTTPAGGKSAADRAKELGI